MVLKQKNNRSYRAVKLESLRISAKRSLLVSQSSSILTCSGQLAIIFQHTELNTSNVNYDLKQKGVRLISAERAWIKGKNGKMKLNPNYRFVGKIDTKIPNIIITAKDNQQPTYKGDFSSLNSIAKSQIIDHFYDDNGKRNKKKVAYFGIEKTSKQSNDF